MQVYVFFCGFYLWPHISDIHLAFQHILRPVNALMIGHEFSRDKVVDSLIK